MGSLLAAELLKTRKRWMPYVLFLVMLAGVSMLIWLGGYLEWRSQDEFEFQTGALRTFAMPWSLQALLDSGQFWGAVLIGILTASVVATEHNWGTVRQALIRGQTRSQYLATKLTGLGLVSAAVLLAALAAGIGFSVLATDLAGRPITLDVPGGPSVPEVGLMILRAGFGILPYGLLAFFLTVVSRSTAVGAAGVLVYVIGEAITIAIFKDIGGLAGDSRSLFIGHNVNALVAANRIGSGDYNSLAFRGRPDASDLPDVNVAALVIAIYCVILLATTFAIFQRRDIRA